MVGCKMDDIENRTETGSIVMIQLDFISGVSET